MTFSRNTEQVVECKLALVEAFEKAKQVIRDRLSEPPPLTPVTAAELVAILAQETVKIEKKVNALAEVSAEHSQVIAELKEKVAEGTLVGAIAQLATQISQLTRQPISIACVAPSIG